ncbi:carbamoyl phosphate synthase small chain, chloroplastic-like [Silene latifolia]|uniref:carbamoyl phosphate synthase small chain, chloroplastic-like n=1 Tax=Silene latifolia TaxID=37657 RepID=UPI003D784F78
MMLILELSAITRRLREDGSLIGVLSAEKSKSDEQLLETACSWDIVGVDLISGVTCQAPYQWVDKTDDNWEFNIDVDMENLSMSLLMILWSSKTF